MGDDNVVLGKFSSRLDRLQNDSEALRKELKRTNLRAAILRAFLQDVERQLAHGD